MKINIKVPVKKTVKKVPVKKTVKKVKVQRIKIEGRWAHVAPFDDEGTIKIIFDDGEIRFAQPT